MGRLLQCLGTLVGAAVLATQVGCASSRVVNCPGEIASPWKTLDSPHFRVVTNRPLPEARIALADFEETYDVFTSVVLSGEVIDPVPIRVVLFDKESDYRTFGPRGAAAFFNDSLPLDVEPTPTLVMWGDLVAKARQTFQHELTHHLFRNALGPVPVWLTEGLAEYYSTVRVDGNEVYIGELHPEFDFYLNPDWKVIDTGPFYRNRIPIGDIPKANELMAMDRDAFYERHSKELDPYGGVPIEEQRRRTARYAGSWALVHMLAHSPAYGERWAEMLTTLVAGKGYAAAENQAFGPVMDSIPGAFQEYLLTHHREAVKTKYTPKARVCPKDEQALPESSVKIVFAQLRPFRGRTSQEDIDPIAAMQSDLDSAVQLDTETQMARLHRGMYHLVTQNVDAAGRDIQAAYEKAPKNIQVVIGATRLCMRRAASGLPPDTFCTTNAAAIRESLIQAAKTPYTHRLAANLLANAGQADEALEQAKQSVKMDPGCAPCLEVLGELLHDRGMVRESIVFAERALAALPETANGDALAKRIREYRKELVDAAKARKKDAEPSGDKQ